MKIKVTISVLLIAAVLLILTPLGDGKQRPGLELMLYYPLDEGGGRTVEDKSESEADGKLSAGEWVDGKYGKAVRFNMKDGDGDPEGTSNIRTRENEAFAFKGHAEITLMAWIKNETDHWAWAGINQFVVIYNRPEGNFTNYGFRIEEPGHPALFYRDAADADWHRKTSRGDPLPTKQWVHVACTAILGKGDTMKFYVNGEERPSGWSHGNGNFKAIAVPGPIDIGSRWAGGGKHLFHGSIDEVMIWKGVFEADEIKEIMSAPADEFLAVQPRGKLATTWATLKRSSN